MDFVPAEKGVPIRQPATANLMIDSADRANADNFPYFSALFTINKNQSLLNGFFTRIGTTEVVLEWNTANISATLANDSLTIDLSGGAPGGGVANQTYIAPDGFYTAAEAYTFVVAKLNALGATLTPPVTFAAAAIPGQMGLTITPSANVYYQFSGSLAALLRIDNGALVLATAAVPIAAALPVDLRPYRYLDFVSAQLTYNQDLKDSSSAPLVRDVLCRWYFAWDQPPTFDAYGFPILMGYTPFTARRLFNPPKQIRWDPKQPVGQLGFEVYTSTGVLLQPSNTTNWLMTLQVSET